MIPKNTTTRTINYFEIEHQLSEQKIKRDYFSIFNIIQDQNIRKDQTRIIKNGDKNLNIFILFSNAKTIHGKIVDIRMDTFPELINTTDDRVRDLDANDNEGILESSHFILYQKGKRLFLSLEHNQYGPRISDFYFFTNHYFTTNKIIDFQNINPLTNDLKIDYSKRIDNISFLIAKIHKDNIERVEKVDPGIASAFSTIHELSKSEYITIKFGIGKNNVESSSKIKKLVIKIANYLRTGNEVGQDFEMLKVRAIDTENNMKMKDFDLLNIWIKSIIRVQKKPRSRVLITRDVIEKMKSEFETILKTL
jgi:hypothetical protein